MGVALRNGCFCVGVGQLSELTHVLTLVTGFMFQEGEAQTSWRMTIYIYNYIPYRLVVRRICFISAYPLLSAHFLAGFLTC